MLSYFFVVILGGGETEGLVLVTAFPTGCSHVTAPPPKGEEQGEN